MHVFFVLVLIVSLDFEGGCTYVLCAEVFCFEGGCAEGICAEVLCFEGGYAELRISYRKMLSKVFC